MALAHRVLPILKKSMSYPDRVYFFEHKTIDQINQTACIHNGQILHKKSVDNPTSTFPGATTLDLNFLSEKFICRKVCEDTEKFEKTHCTFEI